MKAEIVEIEGQAQCAKLITSEGILSVNVASCLKGGKQKFIDEHAHLGDEAAEAWTEIEKLKGKKGVETDPA